MKRKLFLLPTLLAATTPMISLTSCGVRCSFIDVSDSDIVMLESIPFVIDPSKKYIFDIDMSIASIDRFVPICNFRVLKNQGSERTTVPYEILKFKCEGRTISQTDEAHTSDDTYFIRDFPGDGVNVIAYFKQNLSKKSKIKLVLKFNDVEPSGEVKLLFINNT